MPGRPQTTTGSSGGRRCPGRVFWAAAISATALLSALLFATAFPFPEVENDAAEYLALARNIAAGDGFTMDGTAPAVYRPPLFPASLGGWFRVTGSSSALSSAVFQSLAHAAAVGIAFLLFLELTSSTFRAAAGALFLAVNPLLVTRVVFVLQEPTLLLLTTLAAWLSVRLLRSPSRGRAALAGAAWGLCTLAKAVAWFAPFLLLATRLLPKPLRGRLRGAEALALLICFSAVIAPWTARNYLRFERFIPVNGQGEGLLEWNVSHAELPGEPPGSEFAAEVYRKGLAENERKALLWNYVLDRPAYFLGHRVLRNAVHFAAPPRDWWISRGLARPGEHPPSFWILALLFHVPLYLLLLLRSAQSIRGRGSPATFFPILLYWAYWWQHAIAWGDPRYGLAVYPLLVGIALLRGGGAIPGVSPDAGR